MRTNTREREVEKVKGVMHIEGHARFGDVRIDGRVLDPARSLLVFNHSPTGFAWGYGGSGPAQLALAILLEAGLSNDRAVRLHQHFKREHIERLPQSDFVVDIDVAQWVKTFEGTKL
jgi:hypothetical protein